MRPASMLASLLVLTACFTQVDTRGHVQGQAIAEQVKLGETTREDALSTFGSPSSQSSYGAESWYYISGQRERRAFFAPETTQQDVTRIEFDTAGVASKVEQYTLKDGKKIAVVERTTPTEGHSMGVMEQLLGNLGRFNKSRNRLQQSPNRSY